MSADGEGGVSTRSILSVARALARVNAKGTAFAVVVGGGNIWRYRDHSDLTVLSREQSDYLGMLATVYNAVALTHALRDIGVDAVAYSAVAAPRQLVRPYSAAAARRHLARGGVVVLAGGTGRPYVTTDTGAALRAAELGCTRVVKATGVDGVYTADPRHDPTARLLKTLTCTEALAAGVRVFDATGFQRLRKTGITLQVFNFNKKNLLTRALEGYNVGTQVLPE
jgi:uridylate kinase